MKTLRPKPADWNKPFKIFEKKEEFNKLDATDQEMIISRAEIEKKPEPKKEEIIKPKIEVISLPNRGINTKGIPLNYIRLTAQLNLPRADRYQLGEVDYTFLAANENKYLSGGKKIMTVDLLQKCFVQLEIMTGRDISTIPKQLKPKFKTFLEQQLDVIKIEKIDEFVDLIYNRWRSRREQLKNPLLRQLWRPNMDDTSHYLAFRPREKDKEKRNLRRINKSNEDDARMHLETLLKQVQKSRDISERILARQNYKLSMLNLDFQKFNIEVKGFKDQPLFVPQLDKKDVMKLREDYQKLKNQYQVQRDAQKIQIANNVIDTTSIIAEDSKAAVCNFIANLSRLANEVGIDYDYLYTPGNVRPVPTPIPTPPIKPVFQPAQPNTTTICKFNVREIVNKEQKYLQRNFSPMFHQVKSQRQQQESNRFFISKHKDLCKYYYFEDDQEQVKDMKRNISANFKKFLTNKT